MTTVQDTICRELHLRAARQHSSVAIEVKAGEIIALLNALRHEARRGDVAEARLAAALTRLAEERADVLFIPPGELVTAAPTE